ncbi:Lrp/AsnC family transcriptional regulator [Halorarum halobium]|uniref:Lrp/AsnC family transcriptional regulator n=1 Tax=Halorarum halobium TaxID=3075121 RepID=UPI0028AAE77C|nr:Lrp/AsnC family transcriptional regulator [Halobaculum sp. XH14]
MPEDDESDSHADSIHRALLEGYLDEHDYSIFRALNENGRISDTELAEQVGLSRTAVRRRRENLLDRGAVDVHAVIVLQELDLAYADVLVKLDSSATAEERDELIGALIDEELIYSLDSCLGTYDLFVRLWHETLHDVKDYTWELFEDASIIEEYELVPMVHTWKAWDKELDHPTEDR